MASKTPPKPAEPPRAREDLEDGEASSPPRAMLEWIDAATGAPVLPALAAAGGRGIVPSGRIVTILDEQLVEVERDDVGRPDHPDPRRVSFAIDQDALDWYRQRAEQERLEQQAQLGGQAIPEPLVFRETFDTAKKSAHEFVEANAAFFDNVRDPFDGLRDWMDGIEVPVGRARTMKKLYNAPAGRRILQMTPLAAIEASIAFVFGQAAGRRYDTIDWNDITKLEESLAPYFEKPGPGEPAAPGIVWTPIFGAATVEDLERLNPEQQEQVINYEAHREISEQLERLESSYRKNDECLTGAQQAVIERRLWQWRAWARRPTLIPPYACEPDPSTGGYTCDYPSVAGELEQLADACERPYDSDWPVPLAQQAAAGFPDASGDLPIELVETFSEGSEEPPAWFDDIPLPPEPGDIPYEVLEPGEAADLETATQLETEGLIQLAQVGRSYGAPLDDIAESFEQDGVLYQSEYRRNGRNGPYWYAYFVDRFGARRSHYIGLVWMTLEEKVQRRLAEASRSR